MNSNDQKERHIDRIRKLLALSGSSNPHQSEIARKRAEALMEKYAISHMDLGHAEFGTGDFVTDTKARDPWKVKLFNSIGFIFECQVAYFLNAEQKRAVTFYGKKPSVDLALYISEVIVNALKRKWEDFKSKAKTANFPLRSNAKNSFYLAFAEGVLVVVQDMYRGMSQAEKDSHEDAIAQANHLTKDVGTFRSRKISLNNRDRHVLTAGYQAGRSQTIHVGVQANTSSSQINTELTEYSHG